MALEHTFPIFNEVFFESKGKIGDGGYGTVEKGSLTRPVYREVAVKFWKDIGMDLRESCNREITNMAKYSHHPNIVRLLGFMDSHNVIIGFVMEWMKDGSVSDVIHGRRNKYNLNLAYSWISQTCDGLSYLHTIDVVHRDIKPSKAPFISASLPDLKKIDDPAIQNLVKRGWDERPDERPEVDEIGKFFEKRVAEHPERPTTLSDSTEFEFLPLKVDFTKSYNLATAILKVQSTLFYVNLEYLRIFSHDFNTLVKGKKETSGLPIVDIGKVEPDAVRLLLEMVVNEEECLTAENVYKVSYTAYMLNFESVLRTCEAFLCKFATQSTNVAWLLQMGYRFDMTKLLDTCLASMQCSPFGKSNFPRQPLTAKIYTIPDSGQPSYVLLAQIDVKKEVVSVMEINFNIRWIIRTEYDDDIKGMIVTLSPKFFQEIKYVENFQVILDASVKLGSTEEKQSKAVLITMDSPSVKFFYPADEWADIVASADGNNVALEVSFSEQKVYGLRYFISDFYWFTSKLTTSNFVLKVKHNEVFYLNINWLAHHSPFFEQQLRHVNSLSKYGEEHFPCLTLENEDKEEWRSFLHILLPGKCTIIDKIVEQVVGIARRLNFPKVLNDCEHFLLKKTDSRRTLELAEKFNLQKVLASLLTSTSTTPETFLNIATETREGLLNYIQTQSPS